MTAAGEGIFSVARAPKRRKNGLASLSSGMVSVQPTRDGRPAEDWTLDGPPLVAVSADWENAHGEVAHKLENLHAQYPDITTMLHLGDFQLPSLGTPRPTALDRIDAVAHRLGITRILVTPGNHDAFNRLNSWWGIHPELAYRAAEHIWFLRPGTRFRLHGRSFLSYGGAARIGRPAYLESELRRIDVEASAADGYADVLLTHEAIESSIRKVRQILERRTLSAATQPSVDRSVALISWLHTQVRPQLAIHGHLHTAIGVDTKPDGRRIIAVPDRLHPLNIAVLHVDTLEWQWVYPTSPQRPTT